MPPLPLGKSGARFGRAMNKLGWHWWPSDCDHRHRSTTTAAARCINLGHCTPGCAQGAKASTDITYWPHALRAGVELRTRCRVREITTDEHGMASGVDLLRCPGRRAVPAGRAGDRGLQRRRHAAPAAELAVRPLPQRPRQFERPGGQEPDVPSLCLQPTAMSTSRSTAITARRSACGARNSTRPTHARLRARLHLPVQPRLRRRSSRRSPAPTTGRLPWGEDHHRVYRRLLNHRIGLSAIIEDLPEEHNRVTLDPVLKDSNGIPAPQDRLHDRRQQPAR